jgi:hypothetical protein
VAVSTLHRSPSPHEARLPWPPPFAAITGVTLLLVVTGGYPFLLYSDSLVGLLSPRNAMLFHLHGVFSAAMLLLAVTQRRMSLMIVEFFHWIFFYVAPREQMLAQWDKIFTRDDLLSTGLIYLFIYHLILLAIVLPRPPVNTLRIDDDAAAQQRRLAAPDRLWMIVLVCIAIELVLLAFLGNALFSTRAGASIAYAQAMPFSPLALIVLMFLRPFAFLAPLFILRVAWSDRRQGLPTPPPTLLALCGLAVVFGLLLHNPMINARFYSGALLMGVFVIVVGPRRVGAIVAALAVGVLVAPIFNQFRRSSSPEELDLNIGIGILTHFDFDAFVNYLYIILYTQKEGFLWFKNFLTAALFFVPDEIWAGKLKEGTGGMVMEAVGGTYRVVWPIKSSAPMVGEGYIAAGGVGVVVAAALFGLFIRWLDGARVPVSAGRTVLYARACCLCLAPVLLFYLSRGTLLATVAYSSGIICGTFAASLLVSRALDAAEARGVVPPRRAGGPSRRLGERWAGTELAHPTPREGRKRPVRTAFCRGGRSAKLRR